MGGYHYDYWRGTPLIKWFINPGLTLPCFFIVILFFLGAREWFPCVARRPQTTRIRLSASPHTAHTEWEERYPSKSLIGFIFFCLRFSILLLIPHWCTSFVPSLGSKHFPASQQRHGSMAGLRFRGTRLGTKAIGCRAWINMDRPMG